jgi:hypothetical protein
MQLGVARGDLSRSATGAHPAARPAYTVGERAAVLAQPGVAGDRRFVMVPLPRRRLHVVIIAAEPAVENPGSDNAEANMESAGPPPRRIPDMAQAEDNLTDGELQSEIELVGDLVVAATSSDGPLPQDEIDRLLGVQSGDDPAGDPAMSPAGDPESRAPETDS